MEKVLKRTFGGDGNILYLQFSSDCMSTFVKIHNAEQKIVNFITYEL
jgi:hypothetical protein